MGRRHDAEGRLGGRQGRGGQARIEKLAPHDLRHTCSRLCHLAGGELEQIQFLLGHVSIQTTERYLGCKQKLRVAVNDRLGIEPEWREFRPAPERTGRRPPGDGWLLTG